MTLIKPLCTVPEVRTEIGNEDLTEDVAIAAINATTAFVEYVLGRRFDFVEGTDGEPYTIRRSQGYVSGDSLWLPLPCRTLTGVKFAGTPWVEDEDYILEDGGRRIVSIRGYWWPEEADAATGNSVGTRIELVGVFGYQPSTEPGAALLNLEPNVARAAVLIAANMTSQNSRDTIGLDGNRQTVIDKWIPKPALQLLCPPAFVL